MHDDFEKRHEVFPCSSPQLHHSRLGVNLPSSSNLFCLQFFPLHLLIPHQLNRAVVLQPSHIHHVLKYKSISDLRSTASD